MADSTRDAGADVIVAGREPRGGARRTGGLVWLLVVVQAAALVAGIAAAAHYRAAAAHYRAEAAHYRAAAAGAGGAAGAAGLRHGRAPAASPPASPMPEVTSVALRLLAGRGVAGTVIITAAALPGAGRAQFTVSAVITGGAPGTFYDLIGSDCSTADPLPDDVWATGLAGRDGRADLVGYAWTGAVADRYWMALDPSPVSPPPGLRGQFAEGQAAPFPAGQAPCAPSSPTRPPDAPPPDAPPPDAPPPGA